MNRRVEINTPLSTIVILTGFKNASHRYNFDIICHTKDIASVQKSLHYIIDNQLSRILKGDDDQTEYEKYGLNINRVDKQTPPIRT